MIIIFRSFTPFVFFIYLLIYMLKKSSIKSKHISIKKIKRKSRTKSKKPIILYVESCDALTNKTNKTKKTKKKKNNVVLYMKESCPFSKQAYKTLVKQFGKSNVTKRHVISKEIIPIRNGLSKKYKNAKGTQIPFAIVNNKKFIGSNSEIQKIYGQ